MAPPRARSRVAAVSRPPLTRVEGTSSGVDAGCAGARLLGRAPVAAIGVQLCERKMGPAAYLRWVRLPDTLRKPCYCGRHGFSAAIKGRLIPDFPTAPTRLAASGRTSPSEQHSKCGTGRFLRQMGGRRAVRPAKGEMALSPVCSETAVRIASTDKTTTTDRHELGSAARDVRAARGWARLGRS